MKKIISSIVVTSSLVFITGCVSSGAVSQHRAGTISQSYPGVITMVEASQIQGDGALSSVAGGVAGGLLGSRVGGGTGRDMAVMAGGLLGGILGKKADVRDAKRFTVKLDDGRNITTVLPISSNNPMNFSQGSRVMVYITNGRVTEIR
ncbi:MAG TPA: glycine zipper 2TM domain-containing protein [Sulfurimonas sp.]|nr:glycine zipper 2TM domain-containing protein [Sulfurimonas sp.]